MRLARIASLGALLLGAGFSLAQTESPTQQLKAPPPSAIVQASPAAPLVNGPAIPDTNPAALSSTEATANGSRTWASFDYLLWWIKGGPLPQPVYIVAPPGTGNLPNVTQSGTQVLFGNQTLNYGNFSGGRLTAGSWLNSENSVGVEASGFLFEHRATGFSAANSGPNAPSFGASFVTPQGTETSVGLGGSGGANGAASAYSSSRLWGAELNGVFNLVRNPRYSVDLLAGFLYLGLDENLRLFSGNTPGGGLATTLAVDNFTTSNDFYGGQIGARFSYRWGGLFAELTPKISLGLTDQTVDIQGQTIGQATFGAPLSVAPFGVYAQQSNIGTTSRDRVAFVTDVNLKVGYDLNQSVRFYVGYDFLYWDKVARPGDEIDRVINNPHGNTFLFFNQNQAAASGPPFRNVAQSCFWAQGISFGLEFRF